MSNELLLFVFGTLLLVSTWIDVKKRIVPNWIILIGLIVVLIEWIFHFPTDFVARLITSGIILLLGWYLLKKQWLGGGDTKLFFLISLLVPVFQIFSVLLAIFIAGGIQAGYFLYKKQNNQPYVVAICIGYWWWLLTLYF